MEDVGIIERAYQLAVESGSVDEVRRKLREEGYFQVDAHLRGPQIRGELVRRLKQEVGTMDARAGKFRRPNLGCVPYPQPNLLEMRLFSGSAGLPLWGAA